mgnify:CR=1 FL=1
MGHCTQCNILTNRIGNINGQIVYLCEHHEQFTVKS